ncbi:MAG: phage antirepressor N-terminal domain-containing protein, partial [Cardiobacterium hominis]
MTNTIQTVEFHGQTLITISHDGKHYVAMRPICENIGLNWRGQNERIVRHEVLNAVARVMRSTGNDGKEYSMLCLPLEYLNGWLFGVDVTRLKNPEARAALIRYQRECFKVLYDYWHNGKAENPRRTTPDERAGLRQAVTMLTTKRGLMHDEAYRLIHQRFNVSHIEEIPAEQLPQAIEYIHRLALEGELLPPPEDKDAGYIRSHQVAAIGLMHVGRLRFEEQQKALLRLRDLTAQAHERLKATLAETRATLDLTNDILYG